MRISQWAMALIAAACLAACDKNEIEEPAAVGLEGAEGAGAVLQQGAEPELAAASGSLFEREGLVKAQRELESMPKFKGKELMVFQNVYFNDDQIRLTVQDPDKPENIDQYVYREGAWQPPQPVQLSGGGKLEDNLTPLKELPFERVAKMHENWLTKAKEVEGADLDDASYMYGMNIVTGARMVTGSKIKGTREVYEVEYNPDGTLKEFKKK